MSQVPVPSVTRFVRQEDPLEVVAVPEPDLDLVWSRCTELAQQMGRPGFFASGDWLSACARNILPAETLLVLAAKRGGEVKALLPLVIKPNLLGGRDLHLLGVDFHPDPLGMICAPTAMAESAKAFKEYLFRLANWDRLFLLWVLEDECSAWEAEGELVSVAPYLSLPSDFKLLLASFKKKRRYNITAAVRRLKEAGGELVISSDEVSRQELLAALFVLHAKREKEREIVSSFRGERVESLHQSLAKMSERVRLYGVRINGHFVAVLYGFEFTTSFSYYQIAHDPCYGSLSPGSVLLFLVIEQCCRRGFQEFNFLQGNEEYKEGWTEQSRLLYSCQWRKKNWRSSFLTCAVKVRRLCGRWARSLCHGN